MTRSSVVTSAPRHPDPARIASERHGRMAEHVAVLMLFCRGYRILARRLTTPRGEIDIVAARGKRLAFVEVKQRATWAAAATAVRPRQTARLHAAAAHFVAARPHYRAHERGFDTLLIVPWSWPRYSADVLRPEVNARGALWG